MRGSSRGAEARRLCRFGDRAAATTKTVLVSAAAIGAALGEQQRGRRPLAVLRRGGPGAERSSSATGGIVCPGVQERVPEESRA
ncbi:hypothetical protein MC885_012704 [Smutsia gigantea]|nr:hypothetical protein MC885_012704 [Smutsia gigantea]